MSVLETIQDTGINPLVATDIIRSLGLDAEAIGQIPAEFEMFRDIAQYFGEFESYDLVLSRLTSRFHTDPLQKVWEYVQYQRQRDKLIERIDNIDKELRLMDGIEEVDVKKQELSDLRMKLALELNGLSTTLQTYEQ